jgi:hypothetical protein
MVKLILLGGMLEGTGICADAGKDGKRVTEFY